MKDRASVLSRLDGGEYHVFEARAAIAALSTLSWLYGDGFGQSTEAWFSETFPLPDPGKEEEPYQRPGKFIPVIANPSTDRVFPGLFLYPTSFDVAKFRQGVNAIERQLVASRNNSVLGAMEHWHRARGESENHTGPFADVEALWSGFESFFHFPKDAGEREKALVGHLKSHLGRLCLDETRFWLPLARWAARAYETRCAHVHGAVLDPGMLVLSPENLSVFKTGLEIAGATMRLELGGTVAEDRAKRDLQFLFCQAMLVEEAVRLLKKLKREQIYPGSTDQDDTCGAAASLLTDLMRFENWPARFQRDNRLLRAADQIALALSAWSRVLKATASASERDQLDHLLSVMSQHAKSTVEIRLDAIAHLVTYLSPAVDPYFGEEEHAEPDDPEWIRGGLSFWKWASGLRRLYEMWLGHRLA